MAVIIATFQRRPQGTLAEFVEKLFKIFEAELDAASAVIPVGLVVRVLTAIFG
jgi:hypothetical protein